MTRRVVLARHGETGWSATHRHTGRTDVPLTDEGRRQARALGRALAGWVFVDVRTSPLARAADTCTLAGYGTVATTDPDLVEWDYGDHEGETTAAIRGREPGWTIWSGSVPGGEAVGDVGRRADRVVAELGRVEGAVLLFAHGHFLRVLAARWCGLAARDGRLLALDTATISVLGHERETRVIERWNDASHLRGAG